MEVCLICSTGGGQLAGLTARGLKTILECAKLQDDVTVILKVKEDTSFHVHKSCRKDFTNKQRIHQKSHKANNNTSTETRSKITAFCWKSPCFLCDQKLSNKSKT